MFLAIGAVMVMCGLAMGQTGIAPSVAPPPIDPATGAVRSFSFGDAAPRVKVDRWLRGDAPQEFERGVVSVVWLFSTWSEPSKMAIPILRSVHDEHQAKGVRVIGVAVWENTRPAESGSLADRVAAFVATHADAMPYAVGYDGDAGEMAQTWMRGGDRRWVPSVFVIAKDGTVAWMGHPGDPDEKLSEIVGSVVAGTFDVKAAAERAVKAQEQADKARKIERQWRKAVEAGDGKQAMKLLDELLALRPGEFGELADETFQVVVIRNKDGAGYPWVMTLLEGPLKDDAVALNNLAWTIVDNEGVEMRDLAVALRLATRAEEISKGEQSFILDTLARVHFERGDVKKAIEVQGRAVEKAEEARKDEYRAVLDRYRASGK